MGGPMASPLDMSRVVPLNAASQYPGEPVTSGADAGPGPGSGAIARPDPSLQYMKSLLPALEIAAHQPNSSVAVRQMVRRLSAS